MRQFLDIGTGLPSIHNTHDVAQSVAPEAKVVYVDNDPLVLAHARALATITPEGVTAYVDADVHNRGRVTAVADELITFIAARCLADHETAQRYRDAVTRPAGPAAAERRAWTITACDCGEVRA